VQAFVIYHKSKYEYEANRLIPPTVHTHAEHGNTPEKQTVECVGYGTFDHRTCRHTRQNNHGCVHSHEISRLQLCLELEFAHIHFHNKLDSVVTYTYRLHNTYITDDLKEWSNKSTPDLVRMAQDRSTYRRFVYRVAHARNSDTAPRLIDMTATTRKHQHQT